MVNGCPQERGIGISLKREGDKGTLKRGDFDHEYRHAESKEDAFWDNPQVRNQIAKILYTDSALINWKREMGHDLAVNGLTYEAKIRWPPHHDDILIEIAHSDGERGWVYHSTADHLLYVWVRDNETIAWFRIYDLKAIQRDWSSLQWKAIDEVRSFKNVGRFTINKVLALQDLTKYEVA